VVKDIYHCIQHTHEDTVDIFSTHATALYPQIKVS